MDPTNKTIFYSPKHRRMFGEEECFATFSEETRQLPPSPETRKRFSRKESYDSFLESQQYYAMNKSGFDRDNLWALPEKEKEELILPWKGLTSEQILERKNEIHKSYRQAVAMGCRQEGHEDKLAFGTVALGLSGMVGLATSSPVLVPALAAVGAVVGATSLCKALQSRAVVRESEDIALRMNELAWGFYAHSASSASKKNEGHRS